MHPDQRSDEGLYLQNSVSVVNLAYLADLVCLADVVCLVTILAVHVPQGQPSREIQRLRTRPMGAAFEESSIATVNGHVFSKSWHCETRQPVANSHKSAL
jgi:hypothetical protein